MILPGWASPDERKPAPGPLRLVQSFVNTADLEAGTDLLAEGRPAQEWLRLAGLLGPHAPAGAGDLRAARDVRESIRVLLARNTAGLVAGSGSAAGPGSAAAAGSVSGVGPAAAAGAVIGGGSGLRALDAAARAARPRLTVSPDGRVELDSGSAELAGGLARLLLIIWDAQHDGTWGRLKACGNLGCRRAFYDRSHSQVGTWCSMAACGNLIKNRNLRARRASLPA